MGEMREQKDLRSYIGYPVRLRQIGLGIYFERKVKFCSFLPDMVYFGIGSLAQGLHLLKSIQTVQVIEISIQYPALLG